MTPRAITATLTAAVTVVLAACEAGEDAQRTVVCVPVYGQSLALGEEAVRLTDLDMLATAADGRIVTERLDHNHGYYDPDETKAVVKRLLRCDRRSFELSAYAMALDLTALLGRDTLVCTFARGQGATPYAGISRGTPPYRQLLRAIGQACRESRRRRWRFVVPAVCWMHGETDMERRTPGDYRQSLRQFAADINADVKAITGQEEPVSIVCYQTCQLTMAHHFVPTAYDCPELRVPQAQMLQLRDDPLFWASTPVYPFTFAHEGIHLSAEGQQQVGHYAARAVTAIVRGEQRQRGLLPTGVSRTDSTVTVTLSVPCPPLVADSVSVAPARCLGFSVISPEGRDIARTATISGNSVVIGIDSRAQHRQGPLSVRYAVCGEADTTGPERGPRGNLHDSAPDALPNWCHMFSLTTDE